MVQHADAWLTQVVGEVSCTSLLKAEIVKGMWAGQQVDSLPQRPGRSQTG